jgi:hypothetical protein
MRSSTNKVPLLVGAIFGGIGLLLLMGAVAAFVFLPGLMRKEVARLEAIRRVSAVSLDDTAPGAQVALDGRISARNPELAAAMVAYDCTVARTDSDDETVIETVSQAHPTLLIETPSGVVEVRGWYVLDAMPWQSHGADCAYAGLRRGDAVAVFGVAARGSEGNVIDAERIVGMALDAYIARERRAAEGLPILSVMLGGMGLLFAGLGGALLWAGRREY